jgi:hypothetical protein
MMIIRVITISEINMVMTDNLEIQPIHKSLPKKLQNKIVIKIAVVSARHHKHGGEDIRYDFKDYKLKLKGEKNYVILGGQMTARQVIGHNDCHFNPRRERGQRKPNFKAVDENNARDIN